jgi:16S rRNA (uracil1498-N3)-methyltransferase
VLRKRSGDEIVVVDSAAQTFRAVLEVRKRAVIAHVNELIGRATPTRMRVAVAQAIPKGEKLDFAVEKLTELGASEIVPFVSERSIAGAKRAKLDRWRRIAKAAAAQSGRSDLPAVSDPLTFDALLASFARYDVVLLAWELAEKRTQLREILPGLLLRATSVLAVIGPEGGLSHDEASRALEHGARLVSLGSRILRTETAGIVLLGIINYEAGEPGEGVVVNDG